MTSKNDLENLLEDFGVFGYSEELNIDPGWIGNIIGKNGRNIKTLRSKYNISVDFIKAKLKFPGRKKPV